MQDHETQSSRVSKLAYEPALDGLRGLAVALVVGFHAGIGWLGGGYVGVSVFFTLSGFLITRLLLHEHASKGRIGTKAFYARRFRRLLPASSACLLFVVIGAALGEWSLVPDLRSHVLGGAFQVFNWVRLAGSGSYGDIFAADGGTPSPLEHYWSLAIEEQFYWVWPLAITGLLKWRSTRPSSTGTAEQPSLLFPIGIATAAAIAAGPLIAAKWGPDAAYWATPARIGEILTGALCAVIVVERGTPRWIRHLAPGVVLAIVVASIFFPVGRGPAYSGWLPALSLLTAVLLAGLQHDTALRRALSVKPLRVLGMVSYGVYLAHWPLFTLITPARVGFDGMTLLALRLLATALVATVSYLFLEQPIRNASWQPRPTLVAGLASVAVVGLAAIAVPRTGLVYDTAGHAGEIAAIDPNMPTETLTTEASALPEYAAVPPPGTNAEEHWRRLTLDPPATTRPVRIVVFGDSTAKATGGGLARWAAANPELAQVTVAGQAGCGFAQGGVRVFPEGDQQISPVCATYLNEDLARTVKELRPDVAIFLTGGWDIVDQRFDGTTVQSPLDPKYKQHIEEGFKAATNNVRDAGVPRVLWLTQPTSNPYWNPVLSPQEDPARHQVLHESMRALAASDPEHISVGDFNWWMDKSGFATDHKARPDGVHLSADAAEQLATKWLGPVAMAAALR